MPICPNCGSYVSEGSHTCSCGTSFSYNSPYEREEEEDPEEVERKERARQYYLEACSLERQGRYREALAMYERSRSLGDRGFGRYEEGLLYYEMGEYEKALELLEGCKSMGKPYRILTLIGKTLTRLERYDEAMDMFFKAIGIIKDSTEFVQDYTNPNFGRYYTEEELNARASEKQKRKRKELARVYNAIAWSYSFQKNYKVAIRYIDEAILFDDENPRNWNVKAIILEDMGCFDESKKCYDGAISLRNENVYVENRARMIRDWCRELCGDAKKLEKARKLISQAIDDLSAIETDEDMAEYVDMRNEINDRIDSERQLELLKAIGRENLFTITATSFYGYPHFDEGMILRLVKEPDNDYDSDAVAVYLDGKKVGYVANSPHTACYLTSTASSLDIPDCATGEYLMFYEFEYRIARIIRNRNTLYTK